MICYSARGISDATPSLARAPGEWADDDWSPGAQTAPNLNWLRTHHSAEGIPPRSVLSSRAVCPVGRGTRGCFGGARSTLNSLRIHRCHHCAERIPFPPGLPSRRAAPVHWGDDGYFRVVQHEMRVRRRTEHIRLQLELLHAVPPARQGGCGGYPAAHYGLTRLTLYAAENIQPPLAPLSPALTPIARGNHARLSDARLAPKSPTPFFSSPGTHPSPAVDPRRTRPPRLHCRRAHLRQFRSGRHTTGLLAASRPDSPQVDNPAPAGVNTSLVLPLAAPPTEQRHSHGSQAGRASHSR